MSNMFVRAVLDVAGAAQNALPAYPNSIKHKMKGMARWFSMRI
jgi:hypothetical protein